MIIAGTDERDSSHALGLEFLQVAGDPFFVHQAVEPPPETRWFGRIRRSHKFRRQISSSACYSNQRAKRQARHQNSFHPFCVHRMLIQLHYE